MFELLLGYRYRSAAVLTDDPDTGALELVAESRGQPGTRLPHVWLQRDGKRVSTLDLLGPQFTVLSADGRWRTAAAGLNVAMHRTDDREWLEINGLSPTGALLVRPDDFVGWRVEEFPADPAGALRHAVSAILALG